MKKSFIYLLMAHQETYEEGSIGVAGVFSTRAKAKRAFLAQYGPEAEGRLYKDESVMDFSVHPDWTSLYSIVRWEVDAPLE